MIAWKRIDGNPPPLDVDVWLTDGRTVGIGRRVKERKGIQWNYRTAMVHAAEYWCSIAEFNAAVMPRGDERK